MRRRVIWGGLGVLATVMVAGCLMLGERSAREAGTRQLILDPEDPARRDFGQLRYKGGLVWHVARPDFGGLSALHIGDDGKFTALTDKAHWLRATMIEAADGTLRDIRFEAMGRLKDAKGVQLERPFMDSEALALAPDGSWRVSFEAEHRVMVYPTLSAPGTTLDLPIAEEMDGNSGLESMAFAPDGRLILLAEDSLTGRGAFPGWIISEDSEVARFGVARSGGFYPTDLAFDPTGRWAYLLERRFSWLGGIGVRLRRFPTSDIAADATISGETLLEAGTDLAFDNMEGLAIRDDAAGNTIIYMISDDNFNPIQRTILLKFQLDD